MGKESIGVGIAVAVIGGILLIIFGTPIKDILTPPEAIPVAQYNEKVCPHTIYFQSYENKTAAFSIKFQNIGDDGTLFVYLFSDTLLSRASDEENFKPNSTKIWFVNSKQYQDFNFELKQKEEKQNLENFTVSFTYGCYEKVMGRNFNCKQYTDCCNYEKEDNGIGFRLINQICS